MQGANMELLGENPKTFGPGNGTAVTPKCTPPPTPHRNSTIIAISEAKHIYDYELAVISFYAY